MNAEEAAPTFGAFFDAWELFGTPALAGAVAGALLGVLGVYVVLRRMVFVSAALSQAAGLGVALAFWTRAVAPVVGAVVATIAAAAPFFLRRETRAASLRDGQLGLVYLLGSAGTLAVGTRIVDAEDIPSLLFGSAVVVLDDTFQELCALTALVLLVHLVGVRGFVQSSIDPDGARVRGLPVRLLDIALLVTLSLTISFSTRVLGALPVFAFSVLPAMAALRLSTNVPRALVVAGVFGALCGFGGYVFAFRFALPVGASQTLTAVVLVLLVSAVAPLFKK